MPAAGFAVEVVCGVPVVTTPEEIDITNAPGLRTASARSSRARARHVCGGHVRDPVL